MNNKKNKQVKGIENTHPINSLVIKTEIMIEKKKQKGKRRGELFFAINL